MGEQPVTLTFVDLAGSEDIGKSEAIGMAAREAGHINKSLLTLGRVITALATNKKHIPYRDSKLTQLMSEALGGLCKTSFIACVSPTKASLTETSKTLRYAERAMQALNISQMPQWKQDQIVIDGLTRKVEQLQLQLERQASAHAEDTRQVKEENAHLKGCVMGMVEQLQGLGTHIGTTLSSGAHRASLRVASTVGVLVDSASELMTSQERMRGEQQAMGEAIVTAAASRAATLAAGCLDTIATNSAGYGSAKAEAAKFEPAIAKMGTDVELGTDTLQSMARAVHEVLVAGCDEGQHFVGWASEQYNEMVSQGPAIEGASNALGLDIQRHGQKVDAGAGSVLAAHECAVRSLDDGIGCLHTALAEAKTDAATFVERTMKRDMQEPPAKARYTYPATLTKTPAYATILAATPAAWKGETNIMTNVTAPGVGTDYPGEMGPEDSSGLEESAGPLRVSVEQADAIEAAARDSDAEEYEGETSDTSARLSSTFGLDDSFSTF